MTIHSLTLNKLSGALLLGTLLALPAAGFSQTTSQHERAKAAQKRSDHRHHTGAKIVVGSAAGGAVVGGLLGGGKGALIGGAAGAGGGALVNKHRVNNDVKKREQGTPR